MDSPVALSVTRYAEPPESLMDLLTAHLPYSLPLLRRLQFTRFPGGRTETTHILFASSAAEPLRPRSGEEGGTPGAGDGGEATAAPFAAAYLDLSRGPETELWLYASLERAPPSSRPGPLVAPALAVLARARAVRDAWPAPRALGPAVLVGALAERTRAALATAGVVFPTVGVFDKWLLRPEALPTPAPAPLPAGMRWATVQHADLGLVLSRSKVLRSERTLKLLPSASIELEDGTPIAWSFLGPDLSLISLHCEETYRGRGLAKAVAIKLIRDYLEDHGDEGTTLCSADVAPDNASSQGVCKSLGGEIAWTLSWSTVDLDSVKTSYSLSCTVPPALVGPPIRPVPAPRHCFETR